MKAVIIKVTKGKNKGQFRFKHIGDNGKNLSQQDTYHNKGDIIALHNKYYPNWEIEDQTK